METVPMTPQGLKKLRDELRHLKSVERPKNIQDIETARAHGDLSENAEYSAAKERQSHIAGRIAELEDITARAQVIEPSDLEHEKIYFGATVSLLESHTDEEYTYQIVGVHESDAKNGKISVESPLAKLLMGKEEGDIVQMKKVTEMIEYEILSIQYI
jgi:transcription elongation factor GreA